MSQDRLLATLDGVRRASVAAVEALEAELRVVEPAHDERLAGMPPLQVIESLFMRGGQSARVASSEAITHYSTAAMKLRAEIVRVMVDEAHMSLSAVASQMSVSRQMVARLYGASGTEDAGDP